MSKPPDESEKVQLEDGTCVVLRPIRPEDASRLQALHSRLSAETRYLRFFSIRADLPPDQAHQLACVDYCTRMAIVAIPEQEGEERVAGVARYAVPCASQPQEAEAAIVVEDRYQRRGIGTILLAQLIEYARRHGIEYFRANVDSTNTTMLKMIQRLKLPTEMKLDSGVWDVRLRVAATA